MGLSLRDSWSPLPEALILRPVSSHLLRPTALRPQPRPRDTNTTTVLTAIPRDGKASRILAYASAYVHALSNPPFTQ
jgi:hypothetical protein